MPKGDISGDPRYEPCDSLLDAVKKERLELLDDRENRNEK